MPAHAYAMPFPYLPTLCASATPYIYTTRRWGSLCHPSYTCVSLPHGEGRRDSNACVYTISLYSLLYIIWEGILIWEEHFAFLHTLLHVYIFDVALVVGVAAHLFARFAGCCPGLVCCADLFLSP